MISNKLISIITLLLVLLILMVLVFPLQKTISEESVYGWNLMTEQERIQHQEMLHNLKTSEERERYRIEHHNKMQLRAKEMGVTLPDAPLNQMRDGSGMGSGYHSGGGSGAGKGR